MNTSAGNLLLLLAAAQGYFLAVFIFHKHGNLYANRLLALLMFVYSVILTHLFIGEIYQVGNGLPVWMVIGLSFLIGPLYYLYTKYLVTQLPERIDLLHIIPFVIYEIFVVVVSCFPETLTHDFLVRKILIDYSWFHWIILTHALIYMILSLLFLKHYTKRIRDVFSNIEKIKLDWLRNLIYLAFCFMFVYLAENTLRLFNLRISRDFDLSSLIIAVYVYIIGYIGMFKSEVFTEPVIAESIKHLPEFEYRRNKGKYEKSGLTPEMAVHYEKLLLMYMEKEEPFTDSELTLSQLAKQTGIPLHYLSEVINSRLNQSFFSFVNRYRLERVKKDLLDPGKAHLKILAIAFDAGFNSKSSFNQIFKDSTGKTPSEYRNS